MGRPSGREVVDSADQALVIPLNTDHGRVVMLHGEIEEAAIANVIAQVAMLAQASRDPIYLVISTYGGSVDEMFSLYDMIKFLPCPVYTIGLGKIMSAGVLLLASGERGKRFLGQTARIMVHPIRGVTFGNVFEQMTQVDEMKRMQDKYVELLSRELNTTPKAIRKIMRKGSDHYLTPKKAIKLGIVDGILRKQV